MMSNFLRWLKSWVEFIKLIVGTIQTPYQSYRTIALRPDIRHLVFIGLLISAYFASTFLVKGGLRASPLFLTESLVKVSISIAVSYCLSLFLIYLLGEVVKARSLQHFKNRRVEKDDLIRLGVLWGYTFIPTTLWFLLMSVFYYFLPPPRTVSFLGQLASAFFISISITILLWKIILYYLTLRFGLKFDLKKIIALSLVLFPSYGIYAIVMYKFGIFRVPFL